MTSRWNHNIHYGRQLLNRLPIGAASALDVGCGEGWFVRELHHVGSVTGIDPDEASIAAARAHDEPTGVQYLQGDFLTYPSEPASFDLVTAVASLHHMDGHSALRRMADLLRPGGTLGVVGLVRLGVNAKQSNSAAWPKP